jgi:hypothetical protein
MSSKTPNDVLRHKANKVRMKASSSSQASTRLKDMFINSKQREELMTACSKGDLPCGNNKRHDLSHSLYN